MTAAEALQHAVAIDAEARRLEREAIVAWLRQQAEFMAARKIEAWALRTAADNIEAGEHLNA